MIRPAQRSRRDVIDVEFYSYPRGSAPHTERVARAHLAGDHRPGVAVSRTLPVVLERVRRTPRRGRRYATHEARFTHRILP